MFLYDIKFVRSSQEFMLQLFSRKVTVSTFEILTMQMHCHNKWNGRELQFEKKLRNKYSLAVSRWDLFWHG